MQEYEYIIEESAKIKKTSTTFYNPAQKTNRDISIMAMREYFKSRDNIRILDAMSATGLRGIRYLKEIENSKVYLNDYSEESINTIKDNLNYNGFDNEDIRYFDTPYMHMQDESKRINVVKSDCNLLMCNMQSYFDVIDIDPFGSCSEYIDNALRAIKHNGLLCVTSTDKGVLCVNEDKCVVKYDTIILKRFSQNEMALRALLSYISRQAAKFGFSIEPILTLNLDFYLRVFVRVLKKSPKSVIKDNSFFYLCNCGNSIEINDKKEMPPLSYPSMLLDNEDLLNTKFKNSIYNSTITKAEICDVCSSRMKLSGKFWNKSLFSKDFIDQLINNQSTEDKRIIGILNYLQQEIDTLWYYDIPLLSKKLKLQCIRLSRMLYALANLEYKFSLTYCNINAFKTNAPLKVINTIIEIGNSNPNHQIFAKCECVDLLLNNKFNKGLIASKLGPLSLPK